MAKKKSKHHGKEDPKKKKKAAGAKKIEPPKQKKTTKKVAAAKGKKQKVAQPSVSPVSPSAVQYVAAPETVVQNTPQEPTGAPLSDFEVPQTPATVDYVMPADALTAPFEPGFDSTPALDPDVDAFIPEFSVPDGWRIDLDFDLPLLIFTLGDIELFTLPLTENFLEGLLPRLNQLQLSQTEAATSWEIRLPEDMQHNPAVFSMVKNGAVAASIPLSKEVIEDLMPALEQFDTREEKVPEKWWIRLRRWARKHKIRAGFLLVLLVPITGYVLYAIGMQIFFTPS